MKQVKFLCIVVCMLNMAWAESIDDQSIKKNILIAKSTKSYTEAKKFAEDLAQKTKIKLDLRKMTYNKKIGLTQATAICEESNFDYPCYWSRGRYDDGVYISIEFSDAYTGFQKGYYIVVVASGKESKTALKKLRPIVKDAYIKSTKIYMGCMH